MTEQELITVLAIVGNLTEGEITIRKKSGSPELEIEMNTHPIWGIYFLRTHWAKPCTVPGIPGMISNWTCPETTPGSYLHGNSPITIADSIAEAAP